MDNTNELQEKVTLLEERIHELEDFIENAALPLHWVNGSGIITWANKFELDMLGYSKEDYVGRHIANFHADKDVIEDILKRLTNKETLINYPAQLVAKDGSIKKVLINSNVFWKDGKFVHTRCFTRQA
jgi:two-component system sensor histidine kinase VicK